MQTSAKRATRPTAGAPGRRLQVVTRSSRAPIDPDLKEFLDSVLVPMLVREALDDIRAENVLAPQPGLVRKCRQNRTRV